MALLDLEGIGQFGDIALKKTASATEATEQRQRVLLQETEQSSNDGDGNGTKWVGTGDLVKPDRQDDICTVEEKTYA